MSIIVTFFSCLAGALGASWLIAWAAGEYWHRRALNRRRHQLGRLLSINHPEWN